MAQQTSLHKAVEQLLGASLAEFVTSRRPATSWRTIAAELTSKTGVDVSHESLRLWFGDEELGRGAA